VIEFLTHIYQLTKKFLVVGGWNFGGWWLEYWWLVDGGWWFFDPDHKVHFNLRSLTSAS